MIEQRTPEWHEARRRGVTSTDIAALLGVDPYRSEGDVARSKAGIDMDIDFASERRLRLGLALEDVVKREDEIEHGIALRRVHRLMYHPSIEWAMTSLDCVRVGERTIVELKTSTSREWDDGLPDRVEAQVRWQMGVTGYPAAHVAALRYGRDLACFDVEHDQRTWERLVRIGNDFLERVAAGGPFEENRSSMRRAFPLDDGSVVEASDDEVAAVHDLIATRRNIAQAREREEALVTAIQTRMADAATLVGPDFKVTWRDYDKRVTAWKSVADGLRTRVSDDEWDAVVGIQTTVQQVRPFKVTETNDDR